jgi:RNA polymerase sigma-70 factor (ECF subfamily)
VAPVRDKEWFESHRAAVLALCYRLLGTLADAEDIVQETLLRASSVEPATLENPRAYLMRIATHLCLDQMKSARAKREVYPGTWLPEPVLGNPLDVESRSNYACDVSYALLLTLETLTPAERAAFVLHEVFDTGYAELATALERNEAACRQLVTRARARVAELKGRFVPTSEQIQRVFTAFSEATRTGNPSLIEAVLCQDAVLLSDGGGKAKAALLPVLGSDRIARFFVGVARKWPLVPPVSLIPCMVNGLPGVVVLHAGERHPSVLSFEWSERGVSRVYSVRNPEKTQRIVSHVSAP